jgi:hypothetical protein
MVDALSVSREAGGKDHQASVLDRTASQSISRTARCIKRLNRGGKGSGLVHLRIQWDLGIAEVGAGDRSDREPRSQVHSQLAAPHPVGTDVLLQNDVCHRTRKGVDDDVTHLKLCREVPGAEHLRVLRKERERHVGRAAAACLR